MSQEDLGELKRREWADPSGRRAGGGPWQVKNRESVLQSVIAQALERIAQAESAAVIDTCTILKAAVELTPHAEILTLMEEGRLVAVTVPCLAEELDHQLGREFVGEGRVPPDRRVLARAVMKQAVMIGTRHDKFRDACTALPLRAIGDRNDRAAVATAWRARTLGIPLVTDDAPLHKEAAEILAPHGVAVMRPGSFLDYLDQRNGE